jgi:hypothetical protein
VRPRTSRSNWHRLANVSTPRGSGKTAP